MKRAAWRKIVRGSNIQRDLEEIKDLAVQYIKEETVQPLKDLGRFVAWGTAGSVLVVFGVTLMLLGALPTWPHSRTWGYYPSGGLGLIALILLVLLLLGRI